ncbi:DNA-deoxyinosine glycosylase [Candidatus Nomurabacteria bacterium]|nr:DNA-deoxyinosine glycosylase [Candidatus Nomurabacteria bacterium]
MVSADALITSFPPISQTDAKVLILGTMPGERSLKMRQYYGHGGNQFWKIMFACLKEPYSDTYAEKVNLLQKHKIALWDVLQYCERKGSSDNAITGEVPNDFADFFSKHKNIKAILFNGHNAADYFNRYIGSPNGISCQVLPSTSPANTWSAKEEKMKIYGQALTKVLNK